jgi:hypothetical protein
MLKRHYIVSGLPDASSARAFEEALQAFVRAYRKTHRDMPDLAVHDTGLGDSSGDYAEFSQVLAELRANNRAVKKA